MNYYADGTLSADRTTLVRTGFAQWIAIDALKEPAEIVDRCSVEALRIALSHLDDVEVISATINRSGEYLPPPAHWIPNLAPGGFQARRDRRLRRR